jgi:hypothetical protein
VRLATQSDRRRVPRFPEGLDITIQALPELGPYRGSEDVTLHGRIHNISEGGVCLVTSRPIAASSLLRCEITIGDLPLRIATLMQVRWTQKQDLETEAYLSGLDFLI